ncbi:MAG: ferredoxin--NADP reductase [Sandaracinus sp.]|nr:ferredoxin--NADP reductase [Sandaracinus sp.]
MSRLAGSVSQPVAALDVATKLASLALPSFLSTPLDQARRDARVVAGVLGGERPSPVRTVHVGPRRAPNLDEVVLVDALLPRPLAERVKQVGRDLGTLVGALRGKRPPPLVPRRPRPETPVAAAPQTRALRITRVVRETADAVSLYLEDLSGAPLDHVPGQFLSFDIRLEGEVLRRAYSLASALGSPPHVTVKRVAGGRVSNHLVDHAKVGDVLPARGPSGVFTVAPNPSASRELLLVAGGSGITPVASIAESVLAAEPTSRVFLVFGNRAREDVIFRERLAALQARHGDRFVVDHVLETTTDGTPGRLDATTQRARIETLGVDLSRAEVFVCGPTPVMEAAREATRALGIPAERVHEERFTSPEQRTAVVMPRGPQTVLVTLGGTKRQIAQQEGQTLLEAGLAGGIPMPFSCAMGGCAACKVRLVDGDVVQEEPNCLTTAERDAGFVLACCSRATGPCAVEVP